MRFLALLVFLAGCTEEHLESDLGGPCSHGHDCIGNDRTCYQKRCVTTAEFNRRARELALLQSDVKTTAEVADAPIPKGFNVRVQRTKGEGRTFAACKPDEFLISGGCSAVSLSKGPIEVRKGTTLGARWLCEQSASDMRNYPLRTIEAYAFCAKP